MAVKNPPDLQEFLKGKLGWVATTARDGTPNVSIKGSLRLLDDEHLVFADLSSLKTRKDLEENLKAAVMVCDAETRRGYLFKGACELVSSGPLFEWTAEGIRKQMPQLPSPKFVVKETVKAIFDQSAGQNGGRKIT